MKQIVPFTKEITFKTVIGELLSVSLDHDLQLKGEDVIMGNFYIKGKYKMTKASQIEEDYSYKIPCEIAISNEYDTYDATIDIDDFYYDVIDSEILKVNISVAIDNLTKKEKIEILKENEKQETYNREIIEDDPKIIFNYEEKNDNKRESINTINVIEDLKQDVFGELNTKDNYSTYVVYLVNEEDTIDSIAEKYKIKKEEIYLYNELKELQSGMKLVIPDKKTNE